MTSWLDSIWKAICCQRQEDNKDVKALERKFKAEHKTIMRDSNAPSARPRFFSSSSESSLEESKEKLNRSIQVKFPKTVHKKLREL